MRDDRRLRDIVIVGGGSAGWMAAAALVNTLDDNCRITLVESDEIGIVGVGEATIPPIKGFISNLGVNEADFMKATRASFKLGIEFVGWAKEDARYFHPFGSHGVGFDVVPPHQYWLRAHLAGDPSPFDVYAMAWGAASRGRFAHPTDDPRNVMSTFNYAYHFDASLFARFLRTFCEARGVIRIEGRIDHARRDDRGFIAAVALASGQQVPGDFFIDCSGFTSLLLSRTLDIPYRDWSSFLPCNRALAVACEVGAEREPYTRSTARSAGWQWRIPLQHRVGNGYVFAADHISEDEATATLLGSLEAEPVGDPRVLRFTTGRREQFWSGNCLALGLAAGFMEPLESTSLHLVQSGIARFLALFPDRDCEPREIDEYNRLTAEEYERIRDFLILHYHANARQGALWQACREMDLPDTLAHRLTIFRQHGRLASPGPELFQNPSWLAVLFGQDVIPATYDPLIDLRPGVDGTGRLAAIRRAIDEAAEQLPRHEDWLTHLSGA